MKRIIVGFAGRAGAGKSAAASELITFGFQRIRFAGALKNMMRSLGLTYEHTDGALKEVPCDMLGGKTPRYAMQTLGTEWGRDTIHGDLWINVWKAAVERLPLDALVVVDDVRFANEVQAIRDMGGVIVEITRPGNTLNVGTHASEALDPAELDADYRIINDKTLDALYEQIMVLARELTRDEQAPSHDQEAFWPAANAA